MPTLAAAVARVQAMGRSQKEQLVDEIFRQQPAMLGSFLVQRQMGVCLEKMEFLLEILLVCFQAMKQSALPWPTITEDDQDRQMQDFLARAGPTVQGAGFGPDGISQRYINAHPEKPLLAFVIERMAQWLTRIAPEETDKYVMLTAINLVNCIAFVEMPTARQ
jgi:hypothetical protein